MADRPLEVIGSYCVAYWHMGQLNTKILRLFSAPSLAAMLFGTVLLPFLAAFSLFGWVAVGQLERAADERMRQDIELVARALRLPLSHALEQGYQRTVRQALDSAFSIGRVYGAYVYDRKGELIATSSAGDGSLGTDRAARIAHLGEDRSEFDRMAGEEVFSYFVPLTDGGGRISGLLQVTRQGSEFDDHLANLRHDGLILLGLFALTSALLLFVGHRWAAGRHLQAIEDGLRAFGQGRSEPRLPVRGPRELRRLAATINGMFDEIERSASEVKRLDDRLRRSEKMAALGRLAAGVAHELGSPLSTIAGRVQRLRERADLPADAQTKIERIGDQALRMERIIRQLLDFGRANPLALRPLPADRPLRDALGALAADETIRAELVLPPHCPTVRADELRLDQALANLLRNAFQAARSRVRASLVAESGRLCYRIEDDGPGIAPEAREHLFEPFYTTKPVGDGTGLGLAVAHAAAEDHGGGVEAGDSPLGGACFTLTLPLAEEREEGAA